jgi:hypothetical protein
MPAVLLSVWRSVTGCPRVKSFRHAPTCQIAVEREHARRSCRLVASAPNLPPGRGENYSWWTLVMLASSGQDPSKSLRTS